MRIAIVGAGFSGTSLTIELLRRGPVGVEVLLLERSGLFGPGLAYSSGDPNHLLNVRASNMSALADDPGHFVRWLQAHAANQGLGATVPASGHAFAPRGLYGRYLSETLAAVEAQAAPGRTVRRLPLDIRSLEIHAEGVRLHPAGAAPLDVDAAVLAVGNFPPELPVTEGCAACDASLIIRNPWDEAALARIAPDAPVIILGSDLTMVDLVIRLDARGHRGPIRVVSRRGLIPQQHRETAPWPSFIDPEAPPPTVAALMRRVRSEVERAEASGAGWRDVIDALRPATQAIWQGLDAVERQRFLRHVRPWWDIHRHRMSPEIAARIAHHLASGRLVVEAARGVRLDARDAGLALGVRPRGSSRLEWREATYLINCSGPQSDYRRVQDPLVASLLREGVARPDPLGQGLDVTPHNAIVAADGTAYSCLFGIGPVSKGQFWEIVAVPDIRRQTAALADTLADRIA